MSSTKELKDLLARMEACKKVIAAERDKLRELYDEIEGILNDFDSGIESLEVGLSEIGSGIDAISAQV